MRIFLYVFLGLLAAGLLVAAAGNGASSKGGNKTIMSENESNGQSDSGSGNGEVRASDQNRTRENGQETNRTDGLERNQTGKPDELENETADNEADEKDRGISEQVREIIEQRKNGSIDVPQGYLVRIIAKNHSLEVEDAEAELNGTLTLNATVDGKNRRFEIEPDTDTVNVTEGNVTVETNETLELENDSLYVSGAKVLIMPSEVPGKVRAKTIKSAVLHVTSGDPEYLVNATVGAKVLWIFDAEMDVESTVDGVTGEIKSEKRPWWSFLASRD